MLTLPAEFAKYYLNDGVPLFTIVKIVQGSDTWLFSQQDMDISDGQVHGLLTNHSGIRRNIDFIKNEVMISNVIMTFNNLPYNPAASSIRLSDEWAELYYADVTIYLGAGPTISALSDCLTVFVGKVGEAPEYTPREVRIVAVDESKFIHKTLPNTLVSSVYSDAPESSRNKYIPIVYGTFLHPGGNGDGDAVMSGTGPAPAVQIEDDKFCLSDHVLYSVESLWAYNRTLDLPCEFIAAAVTLSADDSSRGTAIITVDGTGKAHAYLYPGAIHTDNDATDPMNASREDDNYAVIAASLDEIKLFFIVDFGPGETGTDRDNGVGEIDSIYFQWRGTVPTGASITGSCESRVENGYAEETDLFSAAPGLDAWESFALTKSGGGIRWIESSYGTYWLLNRGSEHTNGPMGIGVFAVGTPSGGELLYINCVRIRIGFLYQPSMMAICFAELHGREFGSWIDHGDHSNSYNEGDEITQPVYILESLLIDELGFASGDIDHASFDEADNTNLNMNIAIHTDNRISSSEVIREIASQGGFLPFLSPSGKWRLLSWLKEYISADATIHYSDMKDDPTILRTFRQDIINDLTINHGYRYDLNSYTRKTSKADSESQTNYGTRTGSLNWRLLDEDSVDYLGDFMTGAVGLLSREWPKVKLSTKAFIYAALEIGDFINLDPDTFDPQILSEGITWYERPLMITGQTIYLDRIDFRAQVTPGQMTKDLSGDAVAGLTITATNPTSVTIDDTPPP